MYHFRPFWLDRSGRFLCKVLWEIGHSLTNRDDLRKGCFNHAQYLPSNPLNAPKEGFHVNQLFEHETVGAIAIFGSRRTDTFCVCDTTQSGSHLRRIWRSGGSPARMVGSRMWGGCTRAFPGRPRLTEVSSQVQHVLLDATRISDGTQLMLKVLDASNNSGMGFNCFVFSEEPLKIWS